MYSVRVCSGSWDVPAGTEITVEPEWALVNKTSQSIEKKKKVLYNYFIFLFLFHLVRLLAELILLIVIYLPHRGNHLTIIIYLRELLENNPTCCAV